MNRVGHIISSLDKKSGGPSRSITELALFQAFNGIEVFIITYISDNPILIEDKPSNLVVHFVDKGSFKKSLDTIIRSSQFDLLHGHGLWQMPVHFMAALARKKNIPYIITPRGMLEPWALQKGKWKKKLALALYQREDLARAEALHATAQMELEQFRKLGFKNPIALIPNGIALSEIKTLQKHPPKKVKTLLFLSRIHPKKGIELLIEAWSLLDVSLKQGWKVQIAGNGDTAYIKSLNKLIQQKEIANSVEIIGPQFGKDKERVYQNADLFVLPTYSENFGIVVAEALAYGLPVITTKGAPWEDLETHKAGWWVEIGVQPLQEALEAALNTSPEELEAMGLRGRQLVKQKFSIEQVAQQTLQLYDWILNRGEKPEFVQLIENE